MAAPATDNKTTTQTPITLPETLAAIDSALERVFAAAEELADVEPRLRTRIEANRRRSERHRRNGVKVESNGSGHHGDLAAKLTNRGLVLVCRRCGTEVTS